MGTVESRTDVGQPGRFDLVRLSSHSVRRPPDRSEIAGRAIEHSIHPEEHVVSCQVFLAPTEAVNETQPRARITHEESGRSLIGYDLDRRTRPLQGRR